MSETDFKAWATKAIADRDAAIERIKPLYDEMMRAKIIERLREELNRQ